MGIRNIFCFLLLMTVFFVPVEAFAANEKGVIEVSLRFGHPSDEEIREMVAGDLETPHPVSVIGMRSVSGAMPRERNPELSSEHLVVVALDEQGTQISRTVIADPRCIRSETVRPSGEVTSKLFINENIDFSVVVPNGPGLSELQIYYPHWTGSEFILELIAQTTMP